MLNLMIIDLEATSEEVKTLGYRHEIIEIGAAKCYVSDSVWETGDTFDCFVKPQINPILSKFIKELTSIEQKDVSQAKIFPAVLDEFKKWIGANAFVFASFGKYDFNQMKYDCNLYLEQFPFSAQHCNLKTVIQKKMQLSKAKGCPTLVEELQIEAELPEHRAINDVKNLIKICQKLQI
ncbi:MAG: exonuclease domain-containing protein, partial [Elusimicrobiota bacterium]|nr:exonuclease domain-containing protein [Elusimicrobiota bacterium]